MTISKTRRKLRAATTCWPPPLRSRAGYRRRARTRGGWTTKRRNTRRTSTRGRWTTQRREQTARNRGASPRAPGYWRCRNTCSAAGLWCATITTFSKMQTRRPRTRRHRNRKWRKRLRTRRKRHMAPRDTFWRYRVLNPELRPHPTRRFPRRSGRDRFRKVILTDLGSTPVRSIYLSSRSTSRRFGAIWVRVTSRRQRRRHLRIENWNGLTRETKTHSRRFRVTPRTRVWPR